MTREKRELVEQARAALPMMTGNARAEATRLIAEMDPAGDREAVAAFERDMAPVVGAVASALHAGDVEALRGLRALLPHLLGEIGPELGDHLAWQMGRAMLDGILLTKTRRHEGEEKGA